jgi:hypothetical protein
LGSAFEEKQRREGNAIVAVEPLNFPDGSPGLIDERLSLITRKDAFVRRQVIRPMPLTLKANDQFAYFLQSLSILQRRSFARKS